MAARSPALARVFQHSQARCSRELAVFILTLDFPIDDHCRYEQLSAKAQDGSLHPDEEAELEDLLNANDVLMILQSTARSVLANLGCFRGQ